MIDFWIRCWSERSGPSGEMLSRSVFISCTELGLVGWADRDCATDAGWRLARQAR